MMKIKMLMLIMMCFASITGCSKVEEVKNKIDDMSEKQFKTMDEGKEKLLPLIEKKYELKFKVLEYNEYEDFTIKRVSAKMSTLDDTCLFGASLDNKGKLTDSYVRCQYNSHIEHMFDNILEGQDYIESFEVTYTVTGNEDIYDTTKSYETYLRENYGFIYLTIHLNDRPTNEQMIERVRYLLPKIVSPNYQIAPMYKVDNRYIYTKTLNRGDSVVEHQLSEQTILEHLRSDDYNNGKFTDEE